jgi:hypothetical protein
MAVAVLMPLGAILLYPDIGEPDAMDPQRWVQQSASPEHEAGVDMDQAVAGLVAKLEANPDNAEGWAARSCYQPQVHRVAAMKRARPDAGQPRPHRGVCTGSRLHRRSAHRKPRQMLRRY